jgi:hypothetical protein
LRGERRWLPGCCSVRRRRQGSVWSQDGKTIVVQATYEKKLQVFSFDGKEARLTGTIRTNGGGVGMRTTMQ